MKTEYKDMTIQELVDLARGQALRANPEYQRGKVWDVKQERLLIDSILRRFPIPMIYLHSKRTEVAGFVNHFLDIIDGQQRLTAFINFVDGKFALIDPGKDRKSGLPAYVLHQPCPWAGKTFSGLAPDIQQAFLKARIQAVLIETNEDNEIRDLFIRLQAGLPLNAQEKRDAWPGSFSEFITLLAGKHGRCIGHELFRKYFKGGGGKRGDAKMRQYCAALYMNHWWKSERRGYCSVDNKTIDEFYKHNIDFDPFSPKWKVDRFKHGLDILVKILGNSPPLQFHMALHSILLLDELIDDFVPDWHTRFRKGLDTFREKLAAATKTKSQADPFWRDYGQHARTDSSSRETIEKRHLFFTARMLEYLSPLTRKDPKRAFSDAERELLYFSRQKNCAICGEFIEWEDLEIDHITPHTDGGATTLSNGRLVHAKCHPRGQGSFGDTRRKAEDSFEADWDFGDTDSDDDDESFEETDSLSGGPDLRTIRRPRIPVKITKGLETHQFRTINAAREFVYQQVFGSPPEYGANTMTCERFLRDHGYEVEKLSDGSGETDSTPV